MHQSPATRRKPRWPWLTLIPLGLGAWAPIYAGLRERRRNWIAWGTLWTAVVLAGWIWPTGDPDESTFGGGLLVIGWFGAVVTAFVIRGTQRAPTADDERLEVAERSATDRLRARDRALEIAREQPALALEMGIGRPDLPGAEHGGVIDVNNAPAAALARLPGIDAALAVRIVKLREQMEGFTSADELGLDLELAARDVERLRERAVFLPR